MEIYWFARISWKRIFYCCFYFISDCLWLICSVNRFLLSVWESFVTFKTQDNADGESRQILILIIWSSQSKNEKVIWCNFSSISNGTMGKNCLISLFHRQKVFAKLYISLVSRLKLILEATYKSGELKQCSLQHLCVLRSYLWIVL